MQSSQSVRTRTRPERPPSASAIAGRLLRSRPAARSDHLSLMVARGVDPEHALLLTTVPKRVLHRAVDRNQFKRVVRECWRHAPRVLRDRSVMIRLSRCPQAYPQWPAGERRRRWRAEVLALILLASAGLSVSAASQNRQD